MKQRSFFSAVRRSLVAIAFVAGTASASAHPFTQADPIESTSDVTYLGAENHSLTFNVKYNNTNATRFFVIIRNENGETLFQDAYADSAFNRNFVLRGTDVKKVFFIIGDKKSRFTESFEISTETRVVEDVVVKRVSQ